MRRNGFTLLELLLALALTMIVAAALATSLYAAFKARAGAQAAVEEAEATATAGDLIQHEIADALPPTGVLAGPFEGLSDDIQFFTTGPEGKAQVQGDIREIEYTTVPATTGSGNSIVRRVTTNLLADVQQTPPDQPICNNVDFLQFQYFDGTDWQDSWDSTAQQNSLPMAVRFTLQLLPTRPGQPAQVTTRTIPLSCYKPQNQTNPTVSSSTGGIQ